VIQPLDPEAALKARTRAEWNALTDEEVKALGTDT